MRGAEEPSQPSECCSERKGLSLPEPLCPHLPLLTQSRRTDQGYLMGPESPVGLPLSLMVTLFSLQLA